MADTRKELEAQLARLKARQQLLEVLYTDLQLASHQISQLAKAILPMLQELYQNTSLEITATEGRISSLDKPIPPPESGDTHGFSEVDSSKTTEK